VTLKFSQHVIEDIAEEMVKEGLITRDQLAVARVTHEDMGEDLGHILLKKGFVSQTQLLSFLGKSLSIPYVSLKESTIPSELIQKVPFHLAKRYHLIPLREEEGGVVVAMADPLDLFALDDIKSALRSEIKPVLSSAEEIDRLISQHYSVQKASQGKGLEEVEVVGPAGEDLSGTSGEKLQKIATGPVVVRAVNQIIVQAYQSKASDIHLEPQNNGVRIRYRVDGFLEEVQRLPREMLLPLVSRIKILGGLDIAERRIPQDGRARLKIGGNMLDLRVATSPSLYGEKVVLRLLRKESEIGIDTLGFSEKDRKTFADLIMKSHGIFLVTGPTGSGKSTTLYAALTRINTPERNIISIEDPIESEITGVNQAQINLKAGMTFASALRSILRQDPDVIMIGEIRDSETADIAVRAAITGHLVLSTLHTNTAAGTISRLNDLGVEPFLLSSAMIGVLAQRLVRKICPSCRKEVPPDAARLGPLAAFVKKCFMGQGCPSCRMSGYIGRIGIFELAPISESVRRKISTKAVDQEIEEEFRKMGVRSMVEEGLEKVNQGITTVEEVLRVTQED